MIMRSFLSGLSFLFAFSIYGQPVPKQIHLEHSCGFSENITRVAVIHEFTTNSEAETVMNDIMNNVGLRPNFRVLPADVPNAAAVVSEQVRYILYNPTFIQSVRTGTKTNWSAISILAHEIGHHLNGHTLTNLGSRPNMELEADEFSGFILRKMGATLEQSQAAMKYLANPRGSSTHPPRDERLKSIERGWRQADEMLGGYKIPEPEMASNKPSCPDEHTGEVSTSNPPVATPGSSTSVPSFAKWKVHMTSNPDSEYYITNGDSFVVFRNGKTYDLGTFRQTNNERYPYVIKLENSPDLLISRTGELISINGKQVGYVARI